MFENTLRSKFEGSDEQFSLEHDRSWRERIHEKSDMTVKELKKKLKEETNNNEVINRKQ